MKRVHIFGDSDCKIFFGLNNIVVHNNYELINKFRSAVSIKGLNNPKSKLQFGKDIIEYLEKQNKKDIIALKFGRVDIEYVYFYKKHVKCENVEFKSFINSTLDEYIEYINKIRNLGFNKISVIGTNIPVPEHYLRRIQKSLKSNINIEYPYLSNNHVYFNKELTKMCQSNNIKYLDLFPIITKPENNYLTMKEEYRGMDHHIKGSEYIPLLEKIKEKDPNYGEDNNLFFRNIITKFLTDNL
jgi:hypothetical protein